jgi:hypothetical protein
MVAVALVFAPLAPLVPVAAAIVFWLSSWVYKYQLMFVFVTKVESGGVSCKRFASCHDAYATLLLFYQRLWNVVINRMLACLILMQLLMVLSMFLPFRVRRHMLKIICPLSYRSTVHIQITHLALHNPAHPSCAHFQSLD